VRWGFFAGTYSGSAHQPFELSKDLIEGAIFSALKQAGGLEVQAAKPATEPQSLQPFTRHGSFKHPLAAPAVI